MPGVRIFFLCSFFFKKLEVRKKETGQKKRIFKTSRQHDSALIF